MEKYFFINSFIAALFFVGCSSTYTIKDFPSKEKFYEDFNDFVKNKKVEVTLKNDSTFTTNEGTRINNDCLVFTNQFQSTGILRIPKQQIKSVNDYYDTNANHIVKIFNKDGKEFDVKNVNYLPDSSIKFETEMTVTSTSRIALINVKNICYKKNWIGIIPGIMSGFLLSYVIAGLGESASPGDVGVFASGAAMVIGVPIGTFLGGVIGWLIGYDYIYQFNR